LKGKFAPAVKDRQGRASGGLEESQRRMVLCGPVGCAVCCGPQWVLRCLHCSCPEPDPTDQRRNHRGVHGEVVRGHEFEANNITLILVLDGIPDPYKEACFALPTSTQVPTSPPSPICASTSTAVLLAFREGLSHERLHTFPPCPPPSAGGGEPTSSSSSQGTCCGIREFNLTLRSMRRRRTALLCAVVARCTPLPPRRWEGPRLPSAHPVPASLDAKNVCVHTTNPAASQGTVRRIHDARPSSTGARARE
jgi:hypothetical protein